MPTFKITISTFFFVCLFNVAFIPQICLDAIDDLQNKEVFNNILGEEATGGLNIFEEESKGSSKEKSEDGKNNLNFKSSGLFNASIYQRLHDSLVNNILHLNFYQSILVLKITPPPKV